VKHYSRIRLALIVGFISFHSYAADNMEGMDHSNMTPEQMKQMNNTKDMDHSNMTPEQMKDVPAATPVAEKAPENVAKKVVKKSSKKKSIKKVKK
jgi:hypothetical protein